MTALDTDYLVVGAGAMGMAFTDALIDHADVHVTIVDRRDRPGRALAVMLRVDPDVVPTMAKAPTLAVWELDLLRSVGKCRPHGPHPSRRARRAGA